MIDPASGAGLLLDVSDPVLIVGSAGTICFANDAVQALVGWTRPLVGQSVAAIIPDWNLGAKRDRNTRVIEVEVVRGEGRPFPVQLRMTSWRNAGGDFTGAVIRSLAEPEEPLAKLKERQDLADAAFAIARVAHARLEQVVEMLPQAICVFDSADRYVLWNRRYAELYPEIADDLHAGTPFVDILRQSISSGALPEKVDDAESWLAERLAKHARSEWREEQEWRDGRWILHDDRRLADGGAIGMRIDITDIKRREASFRLLFQGNPVPMILFEAGTLRIVDANDAAGGLYGLSHDAFLSLVLPDLHERAEREAAERTFGFLVDAYEERTIWHHRNACGEAVDVLVFVRASRHGERDCFLAAVVDVSDRIRAEARIAHVAHHCPVTGLANRIRFREVAEAALAARPEGGPRKLAIHCLDLDGFKPVNDTHGHSAGDHLLRLVGERLQASVGTGDLVARLGGDEFAVVQTSGSDGGSLASCLLASLEQKFLVGGVKVKIGASLGLAVAPRDGVDLDQLMRAADAALYAAKAAGRGVWRDASRTRRCRKTACATELRLKTRPAGA